MTGSTTTQGITDGAEILKVSFAQETQCDSQAISTDVTAGETPAINVEIINALNINSRLEDFQSEPVLPGHVSQGSVLNAAR